MVSRLEDNEVNRSDSQYLPDGRFGQLIQRARTGDQEAVGELISEYRNYLLLIANEELDQGIQAKLGPSDVVQQTMFAAQNKLDQFQGQSEKEFRAWIRKILKNDLLDSNRKYRNAKRRQVSLETSLDDSQTIEPEPADRFHTPRTDALLNEQAELLQVALSQLSEQHQHVLHLRNWQELSFGEIGSQLGCSADAARKMWYRAVVKLQETFHRLNPGMKSSLIESMAAEIEADE